MLHIGINAQNSINSVDMCIVLIYQITTGSWKFKFLIMLMS